MTNKQTALMIVLFIIQSLIYGAILAPRNVMDAENVIELIEINGEK